MRRTSIYESGAFPLYFSAFKHHGAVKKVLPSYQKASVFCDIPLLSCRERWIFSQLPLLTCRAGYFE